MEQENLIMKSIVEEYNYIINTFMKIKIKKELLIRLMIKLDSINKYKTFRKESIDKIQYILHILDNLD